MTVKLNWTQKLDGFVHLNMFEGLKARLNQKKYQGGFSVWKGIVDGHRYDLIRVNWPIKGPKVERVPSW